MSAPTPKGFYRLKAHPKMGDVVNRDTDFSWDGTQWTATCLGPMMLTPEINQRSGPFIRRKWNCVRNLSPNHKK